MTDTPNRTSQRGFASMTPAARAAIASKGGKAAHAQGTAHEFDTAEAKAAGRKGGLSMSQNREHMAEIGRRGGLKRGKNLAAQKANDEGEALADAAAL